VCRPESQSQDRQLHSHFLNTDIRICPLHLNICKYVFFSWRYVPIFALSWRYAPIFALTWRYLPIFALSWRYVPIFVLLWRYVPIFALSWRYVPIFALSWRYVPIFANICTTQILSVCTHVPPPHCAYISRVSTIADNLSLILFNFSLFFYFHDGLEDNYYWQNNYWMPRTNNMYLDNFTVNFVKFIKIWLSLNKEEH